MSNPIDAATLAAFLSDGNEVALIDLREEGLYGEGHAFLASSLPYSRLEIGIARLVPRPGTRIVLAGEPETDIKGGRRLAALGYTAVHRLEGGVAAWAAAGNRLFASVYTPSKAFAEVVEHAYHTPAIAAEALAALQASGADLVVLDSRTVEEFEKFHVPGAIAVPSAELVHRFADLVPSPDTFVVVSCAGRTRGIIGAQALINAGVPNKVSALAGGTQGWRLAGLAVESGRTAVYGPVSEAAHQVARGRSAALAARFGVRRITPGELEAFRADPGRSLYLLDVRTPEEYRAGHLPGALSIPGGQLVQSLDAWVATRGARIVLADDRAVRAEVTAHWVAQLGHDVSVLVYDPTEVALEQGDPPAPQPPVAAPVIASAEASRRLTAGAAALSADTSGVFRKGHVAGARWVSRSRLSEILPDLPQGGAVLVFGAEAAPAQLVAFDLAEARPDLSLAVVEGTAETLAAAGLPLAAGADAPADAARIDHLFWLHDRHSGNAAASRAYLAWEEDLPRQIGSPEAAGYRIGPPAARFEAAG